jgi:hypothetical protein
MENQIMLLNAQAVGASEQRMQELMGLQTESAANKDMHELMCLVCGRKNREGVIEQGRVLQSRRQVKDGTPPLCATHSDQVHKFVPRLVSEKGEDHWEFDAMTIGTTQR